MRARRAGAAGGVPATLSMDDSIVFKLVRLVNLTARPFVETLGKLHRLTLNEWRVILVLASHPGISAQEVALHTGLDKMTVSRSLGSLARSGRVLRRDDANDKRRGVLTLSAAGRRIYERIGVGGKAREAQLFAEVSAADKAQLGRTLDRLIDTLLRADDPR